MRHATVLATRSIFAWCDLSGDAELGACAKRACDWQPLTEREALNSMQDTQARRLFHGEPVELPTCPACAALVDLALEMRGS